MIHAPRRCEGVRGACRQPPALWGQQSGEKRDSYGGLERRRQSGELEGFPDVAVSRGTVSATAALASECSTSGTDAGRSTSCHRGGSSACLSPCAHPSAPVSTRLNIQGPGTQSGPQGSSNMTQKPFILSDLYVRRQKLEAELYHL